MTQPRSEAELVTLRKVAQQHAAARKERVSSVHLLAAIASREGPASSLLRERRLDADVLLKASRAFDEEEADPIGRAMAAARDLAARSPLGEPAGLHLLLALLADRRSAASRALVQSGVDVGRLRAAAMQLSLGVVAPRRAPPQAAGRAREHEPAPASRRLAPTPGVAVPILPTLPAPHNRAKADSPAPPSPPERRAAAPAPAKPAKPAEVVPLEGPRVPGARRGAAKRHAAEAPERLVIDRARMPMLASLGRNLTLAAHRGELEAVVGRDDEVDRVLDVLARRRASSACLVGPAGVGKTSVVHALAERLAREPEGGRVLVELVLSELVSGTGARGALAERLATIRAEAREAPGRVILFIDDLAELFAGGGMDEAASEIKTALTRGELSLVGTMTPEEHRRTLEPDPGLARRFSVIEIEEPGEADAFLLLQRVAEGLSRHHGVAYADEAIAASVAWSLRYLPGRALPDKAVSILDLAGAREKRARLARAAGGKRGGATVGAPEVAAVVAELADVPIERLLETDRERMLRLEELLAERVVGHGAALARVAAILRRNAAGIRARRPIGTFLLLGPTGVGKTETAKAIAEVLFHSSDAMTRLDLSEYAEAHAIARLVGAPPGYVGFEAGGQLTEAVRRRPYQVILLDEIEKAHRDVLEAFLQVFDEGRLTDGRGRKVDFSNTVLVLTSNLGASEASTAKADRSVGFARAARRPDREARASGAMLAAARAALPPELYNRIDEVLCFEALSRADVAAIARLRLAELGAALAARGVALEVEDEAIEALLEQGGYDEELGARPMKRAIARLIEAPAAELLLRGDADEGSVILVGVEDGAITVDAIAGERRAAG
jgi:ATP-dependent Clp protease ATP-binding subunit ClpC